ncbi:unnamed protein product [Darwinula stevensoni]|uniref:Transporter n=1 Tax=Darwinula stevensoni TaxID=69355 RepID=A0A7R9A531_9CRUS|nr:unnamed protein product [Darwinula stevensoni]CAG0893593.1 unnamed protein product [Darwinula stevensoni]
MSLRKVTSYANQAFDTSGEDPAKLADGSATNGVFVIGGEKPPPYEETPKDEEAGGADRPQWNNQLEFLLSCIAMSVGLGNIWRFPFIAYENGGGAFLIPYLIVLFVIGKPLYFLELVIGQFSSFGCVRMWSAVPAMRGIGYGQMIATFIVVTYYTSIMGTCVFYFIQCFSKVLPWTECGKPWTDENCYSAASDSLSNLSVHMESSSEQYYLNEVLKMYNSTRGLDDGVGAPEWRLTLCLLFSWIMIVFSLIRGVQSSGRISYFTALFPYVVLITLLIKGATLEGAGEGILYFITPQWEKLAEGKVWFAAVSQCFFSLSVGFGSITMYASFNPFQHNVYRDALIISVMDTFTSLLAGVSIFAILGNLKHSMGADSIDTVVKSGGGLAFISYPDAIAQFDAVPQLFAAIFFLMLWTLGVGSAVALISCVITVVCDRFPSWDRRIVTVVLCVIAFLIGLVYVTPGGPYVLGLVNYFAGDFLIFILALLETVCLCWVYGVGRICTDVQFMLGIYPGWYWRLCWFVLTPVSLLGILIYAAINMGEPEAEGYTFKGAALVCGWLLGAVAVVMPVISIVQTYVTRKGNLRERLSQCVNFKKETWGPKSQKMRREWEAFKETHRHRNRSRRKRVCTIEVLKIHPPIQGLDDGVGAPEWRLALCLLFSWATIVFSLIRGVQSSGRISYFTALFPYVVLLTLLVEGDTLEGAVIGIIHFIKPQMGKRAST